MSAGIELKPDMKRLRLARNLRRIGIAALFALLALGLAGAFDPREDEISAAGGGLELQVTHPESVRAGLVSTLELKVTRPGGFATPVEVAITRNWLALFDVGSIDPEPDSSTGDADLVYWSFEPPPGDVLDVTVNLTLRPAVRRGEEATVSVLDDDAELATASFETGVVP